MIRSKPVSPTRGDKIASALDRLACLAKKAGPALYERVHLASFLLADEEWVRTGYQKATGALDFPQAAAWLQEQYFAELCGAFSVWEMVRAYRFCPSEEDWAKWRYSIAVVVGEWRKHEARQKKDSPPQPGRRRTAKVADLDEEREKVRKLEDQVRTVQTQQEAHTQASRETIRRLREENAALREENERLKEEIDSLRTQLSLSLSEVA